MSGTGCKVSFSEEHRHMIRLYMVHHRLPSMRVAAARMIETVMRSEGPYSYQLPEDLVHNGKGERKAGR